MSKGAATLAGVPVLSCSIPVFCRRPCVDVSHGRRQSHFPSPFLLFFHADPLIIANPCLRVSGLVAVTIRFLTVCIAAGTYNTCPPKIQIRAFVVNHNIDEDEIVEMKVPKHNNTQFNTGLAMFHLKSEEAVRAALELKGTEIGDRWAVLLKELEGERFGKKNWEGCARCRGAKAHADAAAFWCISMPVGLLFL